MNVLIVVILALAGLALGSFLNVLIPRLKDRKPLTGRSRCLKCGRVLPKRDLVPLVSFALLKGRCRFCQQRISWRYPLVEFVTTAALLILYGRFGLRGEFFLGSLLALLLIPLFVLDLKHRIVPDELSLTGAGVMLVGNLLNGVPFRSLLLGGIVGAGFFGLQYLVSRGKWVGDGDIRLGLLAGFSLGWSATLVALVLAYIAGMLLALWLLATKRANLKSQLPFGTLLTAATFASFLWGDAIAGWYTSGALFTLLGLDRLADWVLIRVYGL